jgi:hypothetical protein
MGTPILLSKNTTRQMRCDPGKTPHRLRDHTSARFLRLRKLLLESVL